MRIPENTSNEANKFAQYRNFGLRVSFVDALLNLGKSFFDWHDNHELGKDKVKSAEKWFPQALIVAKDRNPTKLAEMFKTKGTSSETAWDFVWMALVNNSPLINWYCVTTELDTRYDVKDLLTLLQESYPLASKAKDRRLDALKNTAAESPLGGAKNAVMLPESKGNKVMALTRKSKPVHPLPSSMDCTLSRTKPNGVSSQCASF